MLLSAVSVLVVAQSSSEIPEGLMNNPVLDFFRNVLSILFVEGPWNRFGCSRKNVVAGTDSIF